jgi:uncharacterized protein (DUF2062 family)
MLFKRRREAGLGERFRVWLWPRVSWRRSWAYYIKRALRLSATPHAVAAGIAAGAFASFTPFIGFHFLLSFVIAYVIRGNLVAGAIGTAIGNPLTFPFIWTSTFQVGNFILRGEQSVVPQRLGRQLMEESFDQVWHLVKPMLVGGIPLGLVTAAILYFVVYKMVAAYQSARRERLAVVRSSRREPDAGPEGKAMREPKALQEAEST